MHFLGDNDEIYTGREYFRSCWPFNFGGRLHYLVDFCSQDVVGKKITDFALGGPVQGQVETEYLLEVECNVLAVEIAGQFSARLVVVYTVE